MGTPDAPPVAVVTGASRGIGKGVAAALGDAGYIVYVTGRSSGAPTYPEAGGTIEDTAALVDRRGGRGVAVRCDHTDDEDVRRLFERVRAEQGHLDLLVNNVWGGYAGWHDRRFGEMLAPFWDKPFDLFDSAFQSGVRAHFTSAALAVPMMSAGSLMVTVSFFPARYPRAADDVAYTMAKAADDRMVLAMAAALRDRHVTCLAVYPGLVSTELIVSQADEAGLDLTTAETPEFTGRVVVALAGDPEHSRLSGAAVPVAELALHYGVTDVDGRQPRSLRSDFERDAIAPIPWPPLG